MQKASEIKWKYIKMFVLYFHVNSANRLLNDWSRGFSTLSLSHEWNLISQLLKLSRPFYWSSKWPEKISNGMFPKGTFSGIKGSNNYTEKFLDLQINKTDHHLKKNKSHRNMQRLSGLISGKLSPSTNGRFGVIFVFGLGDNTIPTCQSYSKVNTILSQNVNN